MKSLKQIGLRRILTLGLSPVGFLVRALLVALFFGVCHAAGWREHTTFLSGTSATPGIAAASSAPLGLIYMAGYFGFVLLTPILILAAGILFCLERRDRN